MGTLVRSGNIHSVRRSWFDVLEQYAVAQPRRVSAAALFPRQGAAETSGTTGTRQIICRKGPERGCQTGFGTFAGKSQASFGQLPVILGDQHCILALQPLAKGSRRCSFRGILPCRRDHRGGVLIQRAAAALVTLLNRVRP